MRARRSSLSLLGKFSILSAIVILLLGAGLAAMLRSQIQTRALMEATRSAETVANMVLGPELTREQLRHGLGFEQMDALERQLRAPAVRGQISEAKVWNRDHRVVYAADRTLVNSVSPDNHHLAEALEGMPEAELEHGTDDSEQ